MQFDPDSGPVVITAVWYFRTFLALSGQVLSGFSLTKCQEEPPAPSRHENLHSLEMQRLWWNRYIIVVELSPLFYHSLLLSLLRPVFNNYLVAVILDKIFKTIMKYQDAPCVEWSESDWYSQSGLNLILYIAGWPITGNQSSHHIVMVDLTLSYGESTEHCSNNDTREYGNPERLQMVATVYLKTCNAWHTLR